VPEPEVGQVGAQRSAGRVGTEVRAGQAGVYDALFAAEATEGHRTELTLSQLGAQRACDPWLKRFSLHMIEKNTRMSNEMKSLIDRKRIQVPATVDARSRFCALSLAGLSGEEFDRCYARAQYVAHTDAVAMFEAEAGRGADPDAKALAARVLPTIKSLLEMIRPIAEKSMKEQQSRSSRLGASGARPSP
jgi:putative membrane protein